MKSLCEFPDSVVSYVQDYRAAACERCGGGRQDYRLTLANGAIEYVCWSCCRTSLVLSPTARKGE